MIVGKMLYSPLSVSGAACSRSLPNITHVALPCYLDLETHNWHISSYELCSITLTHDKKCCWTNHLSEICCTYK